VQRARWARPGAPPRPLDRRLDRVQPPDARDERAHLAAGAAQHATARPERGGEHDEGDPEGGTGERATRGYRKQREQDRRAHQRAGPGRATRTRQIAATSRSWKTIFSASRMGAPRIDAFAAGADLHADCNKEGNTFSDFRKGFAQAWRERLGFLRFFPRAVARRGRGDGDGAHRSVEIGKYRCPLATIEPNCRFFTRNALIPNGFSARLPIKRGSRSHARLNLSRAATSPAISASVFIAGWLGLTGQILCATVLVALAPSQ
jgi:hypothetical protein